MIKRTFLVRALALIGLFVPALYADSALDEGAASARMDTSPKPIEAILGPLMGDQLISGYHLSVYKNHQQILNLNAGFADDARKIEPSEDVLYAIASMTKPIVSLATLILADRGVLNLDDAVQTFIPEFADLMVVEDGDYDNPAKALSRDITIHDLLTHTSGLTYSQDITGREEIAELYAELDILSIDGMFRSRLGNLDAHIQELVQLPLVAQPGALFVYSVSIDVLGRVLEIATDKPLDQLLDELVLKPLEMKDTGFRVPAANVNRLSQMYSPRVATYPIPGVYRRYEPYANLPKGQKNFGQSNETYLSGGAGLISSAQDYAKFLNFLSQGTTSSGKSLLSAEMLGQMFVNQLPQALGSNGLVYNFGPMAGGTGFGYGLGISLKTGGDPENQSDHDYYFWAGAANTGFWIDPEHNLIGVLMIQHLPTQYDRVAELVEAARLLYSD